MPATDLACDVYTQRVKMRAAIGKTRRIKPCPDPKRYPDGGVYCDKHARKMTREIPPGWGVIDNRE